MKNKNLITVLINSYNGENTIYQTIKSALAQTYKNYEILIIDDASNDNTINLIKKFNNKKIRLYRNHKNIGLGKSRILAQSKIRGEYVCILDQDDIWHKNKIKGQLKLFLKDKKVGLVATGYKLIDENNKVISLENKYYDMKNFINYLSFKNIFAHSTIMYKTKYAKSVGWYSNNMIYAQDYDLTLKILKKYKFKFLKNYLANIRANPKSMTRSKVFRINTINEELIILKKIRTIYNLNLSNLIKNYYHYFKTKIKLFLYHSKIN